MMNDREREAQVFLMTEPYDRRVPVLTTSDGATTLLEGDRPIKISVKFRPQDGGYGLIIKYTDSNRAAFMRAENAQLWLLSATANEAGAAHPLVPRLRDAVGKAVSRQERWIERGCPPMGI